MHPDIYKKIGWKDHMLQFGKLDGLGSTTSCKCRWSVSRIYTEFLKIGSRLATLDAAPCLTPM
jgi:hypothetical protein